MDNRPIGIFDSGLGGLTAVKEILSILPQEDIVYFGDTGRVPYGTRSKETIMKYAKQDMAFLQSKNVKMIIAACGTVSSVAGHIGEALSLPFTGVLKPTALAACLATHKKRIGIIGTTATIKSGSYQKAILEINPDIQVFAQDCPLFVPLVENGFTSPDSDIVLSVIKHYLQPFMDADIDTLILGCTHYPILYHAIEKVMGKGVFFVQKGFDGLADAEKKLLSMQQIYWRSKGCSPIAAAKVPVHSMSATVQTDLQNLPTSFYSKT